ncbi:trypsin domain-containing protein [Ditylenchus destructor]|nr:trypsin domain-containing protein [Ditylenchus destructor]
MHTFPQNSCLFSIITLLCTLNIAYTRLVGLRSWIQKLDENELKEIDDACRPNSKLTDKNHIEGSERKIQSGPENRIIDGELAPVGKYPFAGVFVHAKLHKAKCGGTFISPRHVLTARHCFTGKNETLLLMAGGVCHSEDSEDNCPNMDMKISFACLPSSAGETLLLSPTLIGWGRHENDILSSHLRHAMVPVISISQEYFLLAEPIADTPNQGANLGDSGSGGVFLDHRRRNRYILWGVIVNGGWKESIRFRRTLMMKTSYYLDDFCHYIGLCSPTQGFKNVFGLQPKLNLNGVYLPQGQRSGIGKSVAPFKQISTESSLYIKNECDDFRNIGLNTADPCELSPTGWSMVIINAENVILCDAVAVTDQHVITSRECIVPNLRRYHSGKASKSKIFVRKRNCPGNDECVSRTIDFISWTFSHPMAIVQLADSSKILQAIPACFLSSKENRMDMSEGLRGYGTVAKVIDNRNQICQRNDFFCAKQNKKCDQEQLSTNRTTGYGIMDVGSRTLAGIKIRELSQDNSIDVYWRTDNLIATLCIYLGRCDDESYSFLTKVAYFNNFYSMNDT